MRIDQAGLPLGSPGFARTDGLDTGALVTLTSLGSGTTHTFRLLWVPPGDVTAVASLAPTSATVWTFSPTAGQAGTYRIELVVDEGLPTEARQIRIFGVRTPVQSLLIPAANEAANPTATLLSAGSATIADSENNEAFPPFTSGSSWGWWRSISELVAAVEAGGGGGGSLQAAYNLGSTISLAAATPVSISDVTGSATPLLDLQATALGATGPALHAVITSASPVSVVTLGDLGGDKLELWADGIHGASALDVAPSTPFGVGQQGYLLAIAGGDGSAGNGVLPGGDAANLTLDAGLKGPDGGAGPGNAGTVAIATLHEHAFVISGQSTGTNNLPWQHFGSIGLQQTPQGVDPDEYVQAIALSTRLGEIRSVEVFHAEGDPEGKIPANAGSIALSSASADADSDALYLKRGQSGTTDSWVRIDGSINTFLTGSHNNATPAIIGAIYLPTARVLSTESRACLYLGGGVGLQGYADLTPLNAAVASATFLTLPNLAAGYYDAPIATGAGTLLAAGWYHVCVAALSGGQTDAQALFLVV